jgi:hypothetical protein
MQNYWQSIRLVTEGLTTTKISSLGILLLLIGDINKTSEL